MFAMTASLASCPDMRGAPRKQRKRSGKRKARKHRIAYIETYRNKKQHDQATIPVFVGHFSAKSSFPGTRFFKPKRLRGCASCQMRNPWGHDEWGGPWCDRCEEWAANPKIQEGLKAEGWDGPVPWVSKSCPRCGLMWMFSVHVSVSWVLDLFSTDVRGLVNIPFCPVLEANDLTFDGKFWMEWEDFRYVMGNLDGKSWENYGKLWKCIWGWLCKPGTCGYCPWPR